MTSGAHVVALQRKKRLADIRSRFSLCGAIRSTANSPTAPRAGSARRPFPAVRQLTGAWRGYQSRVRSGRRHPATENTNSLQVASALLNSRTTRTSPWPFSTGSVCLT